jgi:hypothetical protein
MHPLFDFGPLALVLVGIDFGTLGIMGSILLDMWMLFAWEKDGTLSSSRY